MAFIPVTLRNFFWSDPVFQSAWGEDFEAMRLDMLREQRRLLDKFSRELGEPTTCDKCAKADEGQAVEAKEEDKEVAKQDEDEVISIFPWLMPPKFWLNLEDLVDESGSKQSSQLMRVKEDDSKFEISLDTHEYRPDEVKVHVHNNILTIEARHEENSDDGNVAGSRHFFRKYTLPEGCTADTVISNLSSDGVLMVTAPKNLALIQEERDVPIELKAIEGKEANSAVAESNPDIAAVESSSVD